MRGCASGAELVLLVRDHLALMMELLMLHSCWGMLLKCFWGS